MLSMAQQIWLSRKIASQRILWCGDTVIVTYYVQYDTTDDAIIVKNVFFYSHIAISPGDNRDSRHEFKEPALQGRYILVAGDRCW